MEYNPKVVSCGLSVRTATAALIGAAGPLQAQEKKPNNDGQFSVVVRFNSQDVL